MTTLDIVYEEDEKSIDLNTANIVKRSNGNEFLNSVSVPATSNTTENGAYVVGATKDVLRPEDLRLQIIEDTVSVISSSDSGEANYQNFVTECAVQRGSTFGEVKVQNSKDVHFGNKIFAAPITVVNAVGNEDAEKLGLKEIIEKSEQYFRNTILRRSNRLSSRQITTVSCFVLILISAAVLAAVFMVMHFSTEEEIQIPPSEELYINETWYITRSDWKALEPEEIEYLNLPVPVILIAHTAEGLQRKCTNISWCIRRVRNMQREHMLNNWDDISYNYLIGGNGYVFEGRGANIIGAHTQGINSKSICLAFIGNYNEDILDDDQIANAQLVIKELVDKKKVIENYGLLPVDAVTGFDSPGKNVKKVIKTWKNYKEELNIPSAGIQDLIGARSVVIGLCLIIFHFIIPQIYYR